MMENTYQLSEQQINHIRESVDIVDIISSYIPLVAKGKSFFGVCPFHDDHSPSMSVSKQKQIYRCFSCGAGGNVFKFVMDYENINFLEAVKLLADKAGIPIQLDVGHAPVQKKLQPYYEVYDLAFKFYQNNINTTLGKDARDYLNKRGIGSDIIKEFGIGLSLKNSEMLTKLLLKKQYPSKLLTKTGLVNENEKGFHDVYYNRIMFPLWNLEGKVIGFSGRIYQSSDTAKYVNTKETEVFKKGELLYNYHRAKNEARRVGQVIVMEGFMDVIRAYTVGVQNVVATMGTAVTKQQALLFKRMAKEVILCFDGDEAGAKATMACSNELLQIGVTPKIVRLEENLDPDEYILKYGKEQFLRKLENPINIMDFKLNYLKQKKDLTSNQDMAVYVKEVLKELERTDDVVLRQLTIQKLSQETQLEESFLKEQLEEVVPQEIPIVKTQPVIQKQNKYQQAEKNLIYYMLESSEVIKLYQKHVTYMPTKAYRMLAIQIACFYKDYNFITTADLMTALQNDFDLTATLNEILSMNLKEEYTIDEIMDYIKTIREYGIKVQCGRLKEMMQMEIDPIKKAEIGQKMVELRKTEMR